MKNAKNSTLFNYAYLSAASYSDLVDALNGNGAVKKETSIEEAIGLFIKKEIGSELTNWIKSNYKVMSQWRDSNNSNYNEINEMAILENKDNSGFSATLFRAKDDYKSNTSKYILAFRGTKGPGDIFKTDVGDIVLDGLAYEQIIDLYNYWQQLRTEKGKTYKAAYVYDIEKELEALKKQELDLSTAIDKQQEVALIRKKIKEIKDIEESNKFFSFHELSSKKIHDDDSATFLGKFYIDFRDSSEVYKNKEHIYGLGLLSNDDKIDIAGHSLGGHLAMAFYRLFPEVVEHAWGFNGAGYGKKDNPKNFFEALSKAKGDVYSNNKGIINLIGSKGPNVVTNDVYLRQPLEHYESFTEDWIIAGGGVLGHGMMPMVQTSAVLSLFASLDSNLDKMAIKDFLEKMNPLLEISSSDDDVTIETILNKLSLQLTGNNPNLTEGNNLGIYNTIAILQDIISGSKDRENLLGKLKLFVNLPQNNNNLILKASTKEGMLNAMF